MAQKRTIQWFEQWKLVPENIDAFFRLMETAAGKKPLRLRDACVAMKVPYTLMHAHIKALPDLKARYDAVRAANADAAVHEALEIADKVPLDRDAISKAKLQTDVRFAAASKWDRDDYGERLAVDKTVTVRDHGLVGRAVDLLKLARMGQLPAPAEKVVVGETLDAEPS